MIDMLVACCVDAEFVNDKRLDHVPGPGKFVTPAKDKTQRPTWSIPRNDRFKTRDVMHPGPGYYEYSSFT